MHRSSNSSDPPRKTDTAYNRRGLASLEFILSLPILMLLGACLFSIAISGVNRISTISEARNSVWSLRSNQSPETKSKPLFIGSAPTAGVIRRESINQFQIYSWLGGTRTTQSTAAVLGGVWDHKEITDFSQSPSGPHVATVLRAAGASNDLVSAVQTVTSIFNLNDLPNQEEVDNAGRDADEADRQAEQSRQEIRRLIAQKKADKEVMIRQRDDLIRRRDAKQSEVDRLQSEYDQLVANNASPEAIRAKREELNAAQSDLRDLNQQIDDKNTDISDIEREITDLETALQNAGG